MIQKFDQFYPFNQDFSWKLTAIKELKSFKLVFTGSTVVGEAADAEQGAEGVGGRVQPGLPAPGKSGFFGLDR